MKNSPSCVQVLHKTLKWLVISLCCFADDCEEMGKKGTGGDAETPRVQHTLKCT